MDGLDEKGRQVKPFTLRSVSGHMQVCNPRHVPDGPEKN